VEDTASDLAYDLGYESYYEVAAGERCATDEDTRHAAPEPVSLAAVMADLAKRLAIGTPDIFWAALGQFAEPTTTRNRVAPGGIEPCA
jgi:hypothetical protein